MNEEPATPADNLALAAVMLVAGAIFFLGIWKLLELVGLL